MKGGDPLFVFVRDLRTLRLNIGRSWAALSLPWRIIAEGSAGMDGEAGGILCREVFRDLRFFGILTRFNFGFVFRGFAFFGILRSFRFSASSSASPDIPAHRVEGLRSYPKRPNRQERARHPLHSYFRHLKTRPERAAPFSCIWKAGGSHI